MIEKQANEDLKNQLLIIRHLMIKIKKVNRKKEPEKQDTQKTRISIFLKYFNAVIDSTSPTFQRISRSAYLTFKKFQP